MMGRAVLFLAIALAMPAQAAPMSDAEVKQAIIRASLASYPGNCPCPYNTDRGGRSCGRRSAYSRPGGYLPICYETDVTQQMIDRFRRALRRAGEVVRQHYAKIL